MITTRQLVVKKKQKQNKQNKQKHLSHMLMKHFIKWTMLQHGSKSFEWSQSINQRKASMAGFSLRLKPGVITASANHFTPS